MPIKYAKFITRDMVRAEPEARFVFGDNIARLGYGGQAKEMRDEPNAIGIATKVFPGTYPADYFTDKPGAAFDDCMRIVAADIEKVRAALDEGRTVYVPFDGLGTGLSKLPQRAPRIAQFIIDQFKAFPGEPCPWADVIQTINQE